MEDSAETPAPNTPRRRFPVEFKRTLVDETCTPGASVSAIALANGLNTNQLFAWRRQYPQYLEADTCIGERGRNASGSAGVQCRRAYRYPLAPWRGSCRRRSIRRHVARGAGELAVIGLPAGTRVWLAAGNTDMRTGFNGLAARA